MLKKPPNRHNLVKKTQFVPNKLLNRVPRMLRMPVYGLRKLPKMLHNLNKMP